MRACELGGLRAVGIPTWGHRVSRCLHLPFLSIAACGGSRGGRAWLLPPRSPGNPAGNVSTGLRIPSA
eukprot:2941441-Rhodomonas_salina.3